MDTTASSRPDFRDQHNPDYSIPYQHHSIPSHNNNQHYSHTTPFSQPLAPSSSAVQSYFPPARQQTQPQRYPQQPQSVLSSAPLPQHTHDKSRQTAAPRPSTSSSLARTPFSASEPTLRQSSLTQPTSLPNASQLQSSLYQPQFKPLPSQSDPSYPDPQKSAQQRDDMKRADPLSSSPSRAAQPTPSFSRDANQQSQTHEERTFNTQAPGPPFPPLPATVNSLDKKPEPFPYSRSLPYPIGHQSQPSAKPTSTVAQTTATPNRTATTGITAPNLQTPAEASTSRVNPPGTQQEQRPLYDIGKLLAAHCTILSGKVYNDKGHNICGVLNQHDKPCKRIGRCPFHGDHKPVTAENSVNGTIDASGTVTTPSTSPEGTHSSPNQSGAGYENRSPGSESTTVNGSRPRIPPKQQYKHGWSKDEHFLFLGGLSQHGKGSWKQIASVVKTRTPTQVQSHAQKYFQRQKQSDKNKRSIHDLSLDSPEMVEVAKKFKSGRHHLGVPGGGMGDPMALSGIGDAGPGSLRGHGVAMAQSALELNQNPLHADRGVLNDTGLTRFGSNVHSHLVSKFGPGQATSATTLGSSLSSGVQIPQIPGSTADRPFLATHGNVGQPEMFGHLNQGSINSGQHRRPGDNRLPMKMDGTPGRDVILNSVRPAFIPDSYQGNTGGQFINGQNLLGTKQSLYTQQQRGAGGLHGHEADTNADHGANPAAYQANALQGLYPQMGGNSNVFAQGRGNNEAHLQWASDSDMKARRQRDMSGPNRDAFHLQNSQLGTTLHGIGAIPVPDHLGPSTGIANEQQVDQPFDATHQNQGNAFANGIFGANENVEADTNVYGVAPGQPGSTGIQNRIGSGGYAQTTGVPMGQVPLQSHFGGGSYHRTD